MTSKSPLLPIPRQNTRRFRPLSVSDLDLDASFLFVRDATEERGHLPLWQIVQQVRPEDCIIVESQSSEEIVLSSRGRVPISISLRDDGALASALGQKMLYIDISGLAHHVWAPLLRVAERSKQALRIVYVEPQSYKPHPSPASPTMFDLSTSFGGLSPLPGFARLSGPSDTNRTLLVAMLGFEGSRPGRIAVQIDPTPKVVPIVGVPGFRMEYPSFTITCNRSFLDEYSAHAEIRFARASCPFAAFQTLSDVRSEYPDHYLYIAPVGTKPHSLGAVWYAIKHPDSTEIVYDFPHRKAGRTRGIGLTHVYDLNA